MPIFAKSVLSCWWSHPWLIRYLYCILASYMITKEQKTISIPDIYIYIYIMRKNQSQIPYLTDIPIADNPNELFYLFKCCYISHKMHMQDWNACKSQLRFENTIGTEISYLYAINWCKAFKKDCPYRAKIVVFLLLL